MAEYVIEIIKIVIGIAVMGIINVKVYKQKWYTLITMDDGKDE